MNSARDDDTHFDRKLRGLKNRPKLAVLLLLGFGIVALGQLTGALDSILNFSGKYLARQTLDEQSAGVQDSQDDNAITVTPPPEPPHTGTTLTETGEESALEPLPEPVESTPNEETPATSISPEPSDTVVATEEEAGFRFDLRACRRSVSEITCDFLVTNNWNDRQMTLCARCFANVSRMIDHEGNEYHSQMATLGSEQSEQPKAVFASGVPLKGSITFGGARSLSGVKLLEVGFRVRGKGGGNFGVQFHDVPLSDG